jgi:hypothetical protein
MAWFAAALPYISAGVGVVGSVMQGQAQQEQANETAKILEYNASVSREDAKAARIAASEAEKKLARQEALTVGKMKSFGAKSGFTTAGTPLAMMADTVAEYAKDRLTTLWTGEIEAERNESQANIYGMSARAQRKAGQNAMTNSLLSGVVSTGSSFGQQYVGRS